MGSADGDGGPVKEVGERFVACVDDAPRDKGAAVVHVDALEEKKKKSKIKISKYLSLKKINESKIKIFYRIKLN